LGRARRGAAEKRNRRIDSRVVPGLVAIGESSLAMAPDQSGAPLAMLSSVLIHDQGRVTRFALAG